MNHDPLEAGMFWAGAVMAFTPIILGGIVLAIWWWQRRKVRGGVARADTEDPGFGGAGGRRDS